MKIELELEKLDHLPLPLRELLREVSKLNLKLVLVVEKDECDE